MKNFKKVILTTAMSLLFFVGLTSMISMDPPYNATSCQADCDVLVEVGLFADQGSCRSACSTCTNPSSSVGSFAVCNCKLTDAIVGLEAAGYNNMGDCVNTIKNLINGI